MNVVIQQNSQPSYTTTMADTEMIFLLPANARCFGYLFFNFYIAGSSYFVAQILPDNPAVAEYRVASQLVNSSYGPYSAFNQLGPSSLQAYIVHFFINNAGGAATMVRVQFAQQVLDAANAAVCLSGSNLFYTIM